MDHPHREGCCMDWTLIFYMALALAYIGYPLYLLMVPPHAGSRRVLSLGLLSYGLAGLFWPGLENGVVLFLCGATAVAGMALLFRVPASRMPWLLTMAYCLAVLGASGAGEPGFVLAAAILFVVGLERALRNPVTAEA